MNAPFALSSPKKAANIVATSSEKAQRKKAKPTQLNVIARPQGIE